MNAHDPRLDVLSELDLAVLHALQIDARAPWTKIGAAVGIDATTAARRWAAIAEQRLAWFTVWPSPELHAARSDAALVRITSPVSDEVALRWCHLPWTLSVERSSAGLLAVVVGHGGLAALDAQIRHALAKDGLQAEVEYAIAAPLVDSQWRLRVLSTAQQRALRPSDSPTALRGVSEAQMHAVTDALTDDVRMTHGELANRLGVSEPTARRLVDRLIQHGLVRVGVDVAMPAVGLGRGVVLRAKVSGDAGSALLNPDPAVHRMLVLIGATPLTLSCRMTSLVELVALELRLPAGIEVQDRWTITRVLKRNGQILGVDGRPEASVPAAW